MRSIKAGLEMIEAMEHLNGYLENLYSRRLEIRVGVHYGDAVVGSIGASNRKREAVIGDAVNVASRVEAANKEVCTNLLISEDLYEETKDQIHVGQRIKCCLRGKTGEHKLFEVVGIAGPQH